MKADLHIHSKFSDGTQWPEEIVIKAKELGLEMISCTDHDTLEGNQEFLHACHRLNIHGVAGVEIDCSGSFFIDKKSETESLYQSEVLGYFPKNKYHNTKNLLKPVNEQRIENMKLYLSQVDQIFDTVEISWQDFIEFRFGTFYNKRNILNATYMKPHLYYYLMQKDIPEIKEMNYITFKKEFFSENGSHYLNKGIKKKINFKLKLEDVIKTIQKDDGYAVIPHLALRFIPREIRSDPVKVLLELERKKSIYSAFLQYCEEMKVWGIEIYYYIEYAKNPKLIDKLNKFIKKIAKHRFHFTWGSDSYGTGSTSDTLGKFYGEFNGFY